MICVKCDSACTCIWVLNIVPYFQIKVLNVVLYFEGEKAMTNIIEGGL